MLNKTTGLIIAVGAFIMTYSISKIKIGPCSPEIEAKINDY